MATYKELKDNFFEEVAKIDVSKLNLSFGGGLKEYAELLKVMADIPNETYGERYGLSNFAFGFRGFETERKESEV